MVSLNFIQCLYFRRVLFDVKNIYYCYHLSRDTKIDVIILFEDGISVRVWGLTSTMNAISMILIHF